MDFSVGFQVSMLILVAVGVIAFCRACFQDGRIPSPLQAVFLLAIGLDILIIVVRNWQQLTTEQNLACVVTILLLLWLGSFRRRKEGWILSPLQLFTLGVFFAVFFFFLPITSHNGDLPGTLPWGYVGEALHRTLRVFVVDIDLKVVADALAAQPEELKNSYQALGLILYLLAPALLFGNLLLLFRDLWSEMRFYLVLFSPVYIFSELNAKSLALAEDIFRKPPETRFPWLRRWICPPVLVFTEVYSQNREQDQELLTRARAVRAICLKKDVAKLDFQDKLSRVVIFLIGQKEEENVSQAVAIMEKLVEWRKKNVQLYVFSRKESDGCILDSLEYPWLENHAAGKDYKGRHFRLRRVDEVQHLIWRTVPRMELFKLAQEQQGELSVLIAGFGSYGMEFFKMLTWFCQFEGIHLKLTVVDKALQPDAASVIRKHCPELLSHNRENVDGDARYDIEVLSGVDMRGSEFAEMLCYDGVNAPKAALAQRLRNTNVALVAMGDDDLNVETALYLRGLLDRAKGFKAGKKTQLQEEPVQIYAVVFDEVKSGLLRTISPAQETSSFLRNQKNQPYHIRFVGGMSSQFSYENILWSDLEKAAYYHHRSWVKAEKRIHDEWKEQGRTDLIESHEWYYEDELTPKGELAALKDYHHFEYFRFSSLAKALYSEAVATELEEKSQCTSKDREQTCSCENCLRRKKSEHMRWNAYMRVCGWSYHGTRSDRAKLHDNLIPWDRLTAKDKEKD